MRRAWQQNLLDQWDKSLGPVCASGAEGVQVTHPSECGSARLGRGVTVLASAALRRCGQGARWQDFGDGGAHVAGGDGAQGVEVGGSIGRYQPRRRCGSSSSMSAAIT
jgi:hypothetical protein